jgi:serine/threonine protein kinase
MSHMTDMSDEGAGLAPGGLGPVRLVGLLGEGGMAQVYLGHHDGLGRQVAVKRLRHQLAGSELARDRLRAEAHIASVVRHDHIVDVLDLVTDPAGDTYLVMEHLAGETLSARIARAGALPLSETLAIGLQIGDALGAVHRRGIVHRDLKTENVLVGLDPNGELLAKLIDFGVAEILGSPDGSMECTTVVGTPESMSPEQALAGTIDTRSDIYSFGVLLYEMVAGGPPFLCDDLDSLLRRLVKEAPLPPSQAPGAQKQLVPPALERLILECLAKAPSDRPQDMADVCVRLELIAAEYRGLADALERATNENLELVEGAPAAREVSGVLPSPVRAVGTADVSVGQPLPTVSWKLEEPARPETDRPVKARGSTPELPVASPAKRAASESGAPVAESTEATAKRSTRRQRRRVGVAGTGLFVAVVVAGVAGLVGTMILSPDAPVELELPWQR